MRYKIIKMTIFLQVFLWSCSGLVSLDLNTIRETAPQEWHTLGKSPQRHHAVDHNISPPLDIVWKKKVKSIITDHPLTAGDYIFAPTRSGLLYMIDYETGEGLGSGRLGPAMEHVPTIHNEMLYAGMNLGDQTLVGFNLERSKRQLKARYPQINTTPIVDNDRIYFGTNNSRFYCVDLKTQENIWKIETRGPVMGSPAMNKNGIFFSDVKGWVYSIEVEEGTLVWEKKLEGNSYSHPVIDESSLYICTTAGNLTALSQTDGAILWQYQTSGALFSSPSLYQNMLYLGSNNNDVIAVRKDTGEEVWRFSTAGVVNTVPLASPDYLYVTSWDRNLYILNRFSGQLIYTFELRKTPKSSPIIYRDYLLIHTANDYLLALGNEKLIATRRDQ